MTKRPRQGFLARWGLPLVAGPAITAIGLGWLWMTAEPGGGPRAGGTVTVERVDGGGGRSLDVPPLRLRNVTPDGVTPGPAADGPLVRLQAQPAAPAEAAPPEPDAIYARIVVLDGRSFRAVKDKTPTVVTIAGIAAPGFADTCTAPDGTVWKCGAKARAELARLIGGRSVACVTVDGTDPAAPVSRCSVGRFDLARWLVEQGWADPAADADEETRRLADEAKAARRGRFGPPPTGVIAG